MYSKIIHIAKNIIIIIILLIGSHLGNMLPPAYTTDTPKKKKKWEKECLTSKKTEISKTAFMF